MNYNWVTDEMFDNKLVEIIDRYPASHLLGIPGVYEAVAEHYNNQVLDELERPDADIIDEIGGF
jgi:hypothetical protein